MKLHKLSSTKLRKYNGLAPHWYQSDEEECFITFKEEGWDTFVLKTGEITFRAAKGEIIKVGRIDKGHTANPSNEGSMLARPSVSALIQDEHNPHPEELKEAIKIIKNCDGMDEKLRHQLVTYLEGCGTRK